MKALTLRNIDPKLHENLKIKSKEMGLSLNRFLLHCLERIAGAKKDVEHHDFDEFFGTWSDSEHKDMIKATKEHRKIDKELWD